ncbi:hypothetical protein CEXT_773011 [Caerostris extrusa]|uniref:Uncharacterized protein n=1 Tax=Caerostris extrusa TaxID=172846 RepID=A0AAV4M8A7_CAEEX|nr:hypothetical protein CEXT_773011 [Caerostris extrusa]
MVHYPPSFGIRKKVTSAAARFADSQSRFLLPLGKCPFFFPAFRMVSNFSEGEPSNSPFHAIQRFHGARRAKWDLRQDKVIEIRRRKEGRDGFGKKGHFRAISLPNEVLARSSYKCSDLPYIARENAVIH